jgi:hypothetical protein
MQGMSTWMLILRRNLGGPWSTARSPMTPVPRGPSFWAFAIRPTLPLAAHAASRIFPVLLPATSS